MASRDSSPGEIYQNSNYGDPNGWSLLTTLSPAYSVSNIQSLGNGSGYILGWTTNQLKLWEFSSNGSSMSAITFSGGIDSATPATGAPLSYGMAISPVTGTVVLATNETNGRILRRANGTGSFSVAATITGVDLYRVVCGSDGVFVANSFNGKLVRSTDDGVTWSTVYTLGSGSPIYAIETWGPGKWLVADADGIVHRSTSNGASGTWSSLVTLDGAADDMAWFGGDNVLYATYTSKTHAYLSRDAGSTWVSLGKLNDGITDDWIEHMVPVTIGSEVYVMGGTNKGAAFRARLRS